MAAGNLETLRAPDGTAYEAYVAGEQAPPRPALLLFTPIFGVDADMKAMAHAWAAEGTKSPRPARAAAP